jgi:hypothetical protein
MSHDTGSPGSLALYDHRACECTRLRLRSPLRQFSHGRSSVGAALHNRRAVVSRSPTLHADTVVARAALTELLGRQFASTTPPSCGEYSSCRGWRRTR